jgi:uncharacterized membrane protein YphA (DoxX/SURF4 family)/thiol-disulfide isomerase/thioredoxin
MSQASHVNADSSDHHMDTQLLLFALRVVLVAVFTLSGFAKLHNISGTGDMLRRFRIPEHATPILAVALPLTELAIAVALLGSYYRIGAVAAGLLLTAFVIVIAITLTRGAQPQCQCFGQLHSAPISWSLVVRNIGLIAIALTIYHYRPFLAVAQNIGADARDAFSLAAALSLAVASFFFLVTWTFLLRLFYQHGRALLRIEALESASVRRPAGAAPRAAKLPIGGRAPVFALQSIEGRPYTLSDLLDSGKHLFLIFLEPTCGPCRTLVPHISDWLPRYSETLLFAVITKASDRAAVEDYHPRGLRYVLFQESREVATAYGAFGTPSAVIVRADGTIGSEIAFGKEAIEQLLEVNTPMVSAPMLAGARAYQV